MERGRERGREGMREREREGGRERGRENRGGKKGGREKNKPTETATYIDVATMAYNTVSEYVNMGIEYQLTFFPLPKTAVR